MSNKTQLLSRLRDELGDSGASRTWDDTFLNYLLDEAVDWYSRLFPMPADAYRDVAAGQRTFTVPPGTLSVIQVECPPGIDLPHEVAGTTGSVGRTCRRQSWSVWGGVLYLGNPASGDETGTNQLIMRLLMPWLHLDLVDNWDGPPADERLLVIWAAAQAWAWLDGQDQKRGRASKAGLMTERYTAQLEREIEARKRAATSRRLDTD